MFAHLEFNIDDIGLERFKKAYVGVVENDGLSYSISDIFNT